MLVFLVGCRGPEGPSGIDAQGVDVLPPTLQLTDPWPLDQYWDNVPIAAAAVDNVAIDRVIFTLDGSPAVGANTMVLTSSPFRYSLPLKDVTNGWHFIGARAYDLAGNATEAAPRPVWLGHSTMLSDTTVTLAYHNNIQASIFAIPDTSRAEGFWVRVTPAKGGDLRNIIFNLGGEFTDTTEIGIGIWTGTTIPTKLNSETAFPAAVVAGAVEPFQFDFADQADSLEGEFFIVIDLRKRAATDTLRIGADDGSPPWGRSGVRDDGGSVTTVERYGINANIIASIHYYYAPVAGAANDE